MALGGILALERRVLATEDVARVAPEGTLAAVSVDVSEEVVATDENEGAEMAVVLFLVVAGGAFGREGGGGRGLARVALRGAGALLALGGEGTGGAGAGAALKGGKRRKLDGVRKEREQGG